MVSWLYVLYTCSVSFFLVRCRFVVLVVCFPTLTFESEDLHKSCVLSHQWIHSRTIFSSGLMRGV